MENNQKELILLEDLGYLYANENSKTKRHYAIYKCFCGNEFKTRVDAVKNKNTTSCGCHHIKMLKQKNTKHGFHSHRLYLTWYMMIDRCTNKQHIHYKDYGERGIKVCERWLNVANFIEDMYPNFIEGMTLDRVNNDLGYSKENCRWATKKVQSRNTVKLQSRNTSGYRGVCWHKLKKQWICTIGLNSKNIHLGYFNLPDEAAKAYDQYIIDNNLEHTRNFNEKM